jgi:xylitol oxidase
VWIKIRDADEPAFTAPATFFGATPATENLHPLGLSAENVTQQLGVPGPWYERLPHFRPGTIPWFGNETQAEYLVPREHGLEAFLAVERLRDQIGPQLFISEIRTIAADAFWMSTAYHRAQG